MRTADYRQVNITGGFWKALQDKVATVSLYNVYERFKETGRFDAVKCIRNNEHKPHIFWDSDVAKWLESAAYVLAKRKDERLTALVKEAVADICANQLPCGYFNSYFQVYEPENIFKKRTEHELYCAGHLIEAAVALYEAGVDEALYRAMLRYADYIYERFYEKKDAGFYTCGHPEIELALVRLADCSGEKKYLTLTVYFLEERGKHGEETYDFTYPVYHLDRCPVREMREAEGHAVRALYLYIAVADAAQRLQDAQLAETARRLFADIVNKKMYVTGGVGSSFHGETFTFPYDLPNIFAYGETCAGIALALFCDRLAKLEPRAEYHAVFERVLYNNVLAGMSADGKGFFYVNPLEMHAALYDYNEGLRTKLYCPLPERVEVFDCSCCPPNLTRFLSEIGNYLYGEEDGTVYVEQYVTSEAELCGVKLCVQSDMPYAGAVRIRTAGSGALKLRVPAWSGGIAMKVNGQAAKADVAEGYIGLAVSGDTEIELTFAMQPRFVYANKSVWYDAGRKAVEYGPFVLCAESCDNGADLSAVRIPTLDGAKQVDGSFFTLEVPAQRLQTGNGLYAYAPPVPQPFLLKLIPYFCWANRGKGDMQVWWL